MAHKPIAKRYAVLVVQAEHLLSELILTYIEKEKSQDVRHFCPVPKMIDYYRSLFSSGTISKKLDMSGQRTNEQQTTPVAGSS